jgi:hypothetical protein
MHVSGVTVEEVESVIADAIPPHVPPFAVLSCESTATGVHVTSGELVSPMQRAALDAILERWQGSTSL